MIMRNKLLSTLLLAGVISMPLLADNAAQITEARQVIKQFATQLKGELKKGMKAGGPVNAIGVCNEKAPVIAESVAKDTGWQVGRTSLKVRNPANHPSPWEKKVLEDFEARKQAGADPKTLEYAEVVELNGQKVFRYMKAIPTAKVCLNCHGGDNVRPEVEARIKSLYPTDMARGFKEGDIRGAFVVEKTF